MYSRPLGWSRSKNSYSLQEKLPLKYGVSHVVGKYVKDKKHPGTQIWFIKNVKQYTNIVDQREENENAQREVYAQELFRVFMPNHPKTRITCDEKGIMYVASQGIENFKQLDEINNLEAGLISGKYQGLGEVMVMSLLMNEVDLKFENMGLDKNKRIVKIDGDWCFAAKNGFEGNNEISESLIQGLPDPGNYQAHNWFGYYSSGVVYPKPSELTKSLDTELFRQEVNSALLKAMLMPDELFVRLASHHMEPHLVQESANIMIERKKQMQESALRNESFLAFLESDQALTIASNFVGNLIKFNMTGETPLVNDEKYIQQVDKKFVELGKDVVDVHRANIELDERLCSSIRKNRIDDVRKILPQAMADPNIHAKYSRVDNLPLHIAADNNQTEITKLLLASSKIDPNLQDNDGNTALHFAASNSRVEMTELLLESSKIRPDIKNDEGNTALHLAAKKNKLDVVIKLGKKIDPNIRNKQGLTPLHFAAENNNIKLVEYLIKNGADPTLGDKEGDCPRQYSSDKKVIAILDKEEMRLKSESKSNLTMRK